MFSFFRARTPEAALTRDLTRSARGFREIEVAFDGLQAIVSRTDTSDVIVSEDVSAMLAIEDRTLRGDAIHQRVGMWLGALALASMNAARLLPVLRNKDLADNLPSAPCTAGDPWRADFDGDLEMLAVMDLPSVLVTVAGEDMAQLGLTQATAAARLRDNWAAQPHITEIYMMPDKVASLTLPTAPTLIGNLMLDGGLTPALKELGWDAALLAFGGRDTLFLADATRDDARAVIAETLDLPGITPESRAVWSVAGDGSVTPLVG